MTEPDITWHLCEAVNSGRSPSMDEIADAIAEIRSLRAENERLLDDRDHLRSRAGIECGCGYDKQGDVCLCHLPVFFALRARVANLEAENAAIRALMDCYNLGGWTDAIAPMNRALAAEAERDRLREALTMLADGTTPWMDSDPDKPLRESWEVMADYARAALGKQPQEGE